MLRRTILKLPAVPVVLGASTKAPQIDAKAPRLHVWLQTSLQRVFPNSPAADRNHLDLLSARNQRLSFQVCVRNDSEREVAVECQLAGPPEIEARVRRVGYVPLPHHTTQTPVSDLDGIGHVPGLVPDPLFPEQSSSVGPLETQSFWVSLFVPANAAPGKKELAVKMLGKPNKSSLR